MTIKACQGTGLNAENVELAVWTREQTLSTGVGNSVAVPHARIDGLNRPLVVVGISETGIDFDSPDGDLARIIFLILTPAEDSGAADGTAGPAGS